MGDINDNNTNEKNGISININRSKGGNGITMLYLKARGFIPEVLSHQKLKTNLPKEDEVQDDTDYKEN